ncbi:MAG TPA: hypothetical protein VEF04_00005, partial [Blastocatellia bacterium]|nr:hypothetical protein [Blastocatellia bacterium]
SSSSSSSSQIDANLLPMVAELERAFHLPVSPELEFHARLDRVVQQCRKHTEEILRTAHQQRDEVRRAVADVRPSSSVEK